MRPCLFPSPPVRLSCPGNLGEEELQSGPNPVIGKEEESGEAPPLFQRTRPVQVFVKEKAGESWGSSRHHLSIIALPLSPGPPPMMEGGRLRVCLWPLGTLRNRSLKEETCSFRNGMPLHSFSGNCQFSFFWHWKKKN